MLLVIISVQQSDIGLAYIKLGKSLGHNEKIYM